MNTPLRNLVRTYAYGLETLQSNGRSVHVRVTGSDYSGMYQEQTLFASINRLSQATSLPVIPTPIIIYSPLIVDWAGSKLSKSLYVSKGAYQYLRDQGYDYLLSYKRMKEMGKDVVVLVRAVEEWMEDTNKMFRSYSIEYLRRRFGDHSNCVLEASATADGCTSSL
jgi:hypothetical protein